MESVERKVEAECFVRQYSFKVAADLPENELAQFLMENQSLEMTRENRDRDGIWSDFNRWLCARTPDRLVLMPRYSKPSVRKRLVANSVVTLLETKIYNFYSRNEKSWQTYG